MKLVSYLTNGALFFKNFNLKRLKKEKSFIIVSLNKCCVFYYLRKSEKLAYLEETFQRY